MTRHFWVLLHRYAGLAMAGFLVIVGLTGSLLAFRAELEHLLSPQLVAVNTGSPRLDPLTLIKSAEALAPKAQVNSLSLGDPDAVYVSVSPRIDPATSNTYELGFDQLILDPYTGKELGRRTWGAISEGRINLMPFIYKLHFNLALDDVGMWALGITALIWTLDSFVGFYLTLPARRKKQGLSVRPEPFDLAQESLVEGGTVKPIMVRQAHHERFNYTLPNNSFWQRWKPAWLIKWRGSKYRINFDLHRAGGLWLWAMLLVFAWSSVYMNLWDTVYTKTTQLVFDYHAPWTDLRKRDKPLAQPAIDWPQALKIGESLLNKAAAENSFTIDQPSYVWLNRELGVYGYSVRSSRDIQDKQGATQVLFDADTGEQSLLLLPSGQYNGNTVTSWLAALHMANVFGLPYRIFVSVLGLAIIMLSVTGIIIWLRKRRAARLSKRI
ncbi:MAG: PepSY-associated TM helix domain-containing protein [Methylobacter sp.]|nr:PepSY-associated TM helix domain-containing protein [Methylobacter sp.]